MADQFAKIREKGLYQPAFEHDNCGIGAIIDVKGTKSHSLVCDALSIVEHLEHRAGKDAEGKTADWAKIPYDLLGRISNRIINEVEHVNRVVYDITQK